MANIQIVGNLTADPKLYGKKDETPRAVFTIAVNERPRDGEEEGPSHFLNCTAWGTLAENIVESLGKGTRVVALGRVNTYKKDVEIDGDEVNLTMTSFTVTAIGPDLRWATADVTKVQPSENGKGKGSKRRKDDDEDEAPKTKKGKKGKAPRRDDDDEDEDF